MSDDIFIDEKIIGYFDVGDDSIIVSKILGVNQSENTVFGEFVFYKGNDIIFRLDISDAMLMGKILSENARELYRDVVDNVIVIASYQQLDEELSSHGNEELI